MSEEEISETLIKTLPDLTDVQHIKLMKLIHDYGIEQRLEELDELPLHDMRFKGNLTIFNRKTELKKQLGREIVRTRP